LVADRPERVRLVELLPALRRVQLGAARLRLRRRAGEREAARLMLALALLRALAVELLADLRPLERLLGAVDLGQRDGLVLLSHAAEVLALPRSAPGVGAAVRRAVTGGAGRGGRGIAPVRAAGRLLRRRPAPPPPV